MPRFLLYGLQSPINIGMILRVAETFGLDVIIHDLHGVFDAPAHRETVEDFACGALERHPPVLVPDAGSVMRATASGLLVATTIESTATALPGFAWDNPDRLIIVLGNEYDGLPSDVIGDAPLKLRVPLPDGFSPKPRSVHPIDPARCRPVAHDGLPNLNVAITAGIIAYSYYLWSLRAASHP